MLDRRTNPMTDFETVAKTRRSVRQYLSDPVPHETLAKVLDHAQYAPSNCNTQPWRVHILSGDVKDTFGKLIEAAYDAEQDTADFSFAIDDFDDASRMRAREQGAAYYNALGIAREDFDQRQDAIKRNLSFFGAPHVALLFMPTVGDNVRVAADIGMYAQNFLLSLVANGLAGIPQTMLGSFADPARSLLGLSDDMKLLFGISFGYPDHEHLASRYEIGRIPVSESVFLHG
jgi:nitroreductase